MIINKTDCYKLGHVFQYPEKTQVIYSNFTPRSDKLFAHKSIFWDRRVVVFGIQALIARMVREFNETFFSVEKEKACRDYARRVKSLLGPASGTDVSHVEELHDLGYLPIMIKALPEGTRVPVGVQVLTIYNTVREMFWLVNYLETYMSCELWKPMTCATIAYEYRRTLDHYAAKTGVSPLFVQWQGHDLSYRGMGNSADAAACGAGHLLSFTGTDTIPALDFLEEYYFADSDKELIGGSVPATEHSVMCAGGSEPGEELETFRRLIEDIYPSGIVSIVSDTWDYWDVITNKAAILKDKIEARGYDTFGNSKVVFRPDCYDDQTQILTDKGWVYFEDLTDSMKVAQVDDLGEYTFVTPEKYIKHEYTGTMCHFKDFHGKVDLAVTPNHRMILNQAGKVRIVEAGKLSNKGHSGQSMARSAKAKTTSTGMSWMERLKVAFQADGSYCTGITSTIRFTFQKQRKIDRLLELASHCNIPAKVYNLADGRKEIHLRVDSHDFLKDFSWVDTSNLCGKWCEDFIDELSYWDSSIRDAGRIKFDTTNREVVEVVELIALSAGKGVLISKYEDNRKAHFSDVYTASILSRNIVGGQSWVKEEVDYSGYVYCVKVPTGKLIVKRNRCTMVCGNSGDPVRIICGYRDDELTWNEDNEIVSIETGQVLTEAEIKGSVRCLFEIFGGSINEKGYIDLSPRVGLIYGDSITLARCEEICSRLEQAGFSASCIVFGIGSFTYQYNTRDSLGFAMKATYSVIDDTPKAMQKDPKTGDGMKKSATGLLRVNEDLTLYQNVNVAEEVEGMLQPVFYNGQVMNQTTLAKIRNLLLG